MAKDDAIRLRHMLDAAHEARAFTEGRARADLDGDRMLTLALVKCIEIIGEAAAQISDEMRAAASRHPVEKHHRHEEQAHPRVSRR